MFAKVPDRSQDFKIPEILEPAGRWASEADLIKAFEDARKNADSIRITNDDLRDHFFDRPLSGPMDGYQWLLLIATPSARPTAQIEEVTTNPNFPQ